MGGRLDGKVALVTGAGAPRGIGRAIALVMAREGAGIAAADIDPRTCEETAQRVRALGGRAVAIQADVSVGAQVEAMVGQAIVAFDRALP